MSVNQSTTIAIESESGSRESGHEHQPTPVSVAALPPSGGDDREPQETQSEEPETKIQSIADRIVAIALEKYELGVTTANDAFAILKGGPNVAKILRKNNSMRAELAKLYRQIHKRTPPAAALADALNVLEGIAHDSTPSSTSLRLGRHGDSIVLDLGRKDGKVVVVSASGWQIEDRSPILFRRTTLTNECPLPERGGSLNALRGLINVSNDDWLLLRGWLIAAMLPDIQHPILMLGGLQGTGKSTALKLLVGVIDPSDAPLRTEPRNDGDWATSASASWIIGLDNVSRIPQWLNDALCKAVTGDGYIRRKLYTDSELHVDSFRRVVGITSIDAGALKGDLGDRLLLVDLEPISAQSRRAESEIMASYETERPKLLGALLDELVATLANLRSLGLREMPRLADFARVLAASGSAGERALQIYEQQGERVADEVIDSDPVALAIVNFVEREGIWRGRASELLAKLGPDQAGKDWPATAQGLGGRIKRLIPALKAKGIEVDIGRKSDSKRTRFISLSKAVEEAVPDLVEKSDQGACQGLDESDESDDLPPIFEYEDGEEVMEWNA